MQKVTSKNTKNEILDAYEGLLTEVKDNKLNKSDQQKAQANSQLITKSLAQNSKEIIRGFKFVHILVQQKIVK